MNGMGWKDGTISQQNLVEAYLDEFIEESDKHLAHEGLTPQILDQVELEKCGIEYNIVLSKKLIKVIGEPRRDTLALWDILKCAAALRLLRDSNNKYEIFALTRLLYTSMSFDDIINAYDNGENEALSNKARKGGEAPKKTQSQVRLIQFAISKLLKQNPNQNAHSMWEKLIKAPSVEKLIDDYLEDYDEKIPMIELDFKNNQIIFGEGEKRSTMTWGTFKNHVSKVRKMHDQQVSRD